MFIAVGIGKDGNGSVIIRCGEMGAYVLTRERGGQWFEAFWDHAQDRQKIVDVTGRYTPASIVKPHEVV